MVAKRTANLFSVDLRRKNKKEKTKKIFKKNQKVIQYHR